MVAGATGAEVEGGAAPNVTGFGALGAAAAKTGAAGVVDAGAAPKTAGAALKTAGAVTFASSGAAPNMGVGGAALNTAGAASKAAGVGTGGIITVASLELGSAAKVPNTSGCEAEGSNWISGAGVAAISSGASANVTVCSMAAVGAAERDRDTSPCRQARERSRQSR